ncbi:MAG: hypothetical protein MK066_00375 [Crocinitomicaceae bacterium]|nr:hypothetical protein [Crocinitomicaceae bacterium]
MLIGQDFDKIEWDVLGLHLLEPNAFFGDMLIAIVGFYFAYKTASLKKNTPFFSFWKLAFISFGFTFITGGFGHLFFHYWGVPGKYLGWYVGIFTPYFIEQATLSLIQHTKQKKFLILLSKIKFIIAVIGTSLMILFMDLESDPTRGMSIVTPHIIIGLVFCLGYLGYIYSKRIHRSFTYMWISVITILPSAIFQSQKINFFQWFDRNDVSHLLIIIGMFFYFACIKAYSKVVID